MKFFLIFFLGMISKVYAIINMVAIAFRVNADSKTITFSPFLKSIISKETISSLSNFMFANHLKTFKDTDGILLIRNGI